MTMPGPIDCHLPMPRRASESAGARSGGNADVEALLAMLDENAVAGGVLVQPGDGDALIQALAAAPERLRGIAAAAPDLGRAAIERLQGAGVVGLRIDLVGRDVPVLAGPPWRGFIDMIGWRGLHLDIDAADDQWAEILPPLLDAGVRVVIDHFGRPRGGRECRGFRAILDAGQRADLWVKLSAPEAGSDAAAADCAASLLDALGPGRLLWGSDLAPAQRHEYRAALDRLATWIPDAATRQRVLVDNPAQIYGFGAPSDGASWASLV